MCLASCKSPQSCVIHARRSPLHAPDAAATRHRAAVIAENIP
jgi:hypothetical protein